MNLEQALDELTRWEREAKRLEAKLKERDRAHDKALVEATTMDLMAVVQVALKKGNDPLARMQELLDKFRAG